MYTDTNYTDLVEIRQKITDSDTDHLIVGVDSSTVNSLGIAGLVVQAYKDDVPKGSIAIKISDEGLNFMQNYEESELEESEVETVDNPTPYSIRKDIPITPIKKNKGRKADKYPFAVMSVDDSFHVPVTEANPNPGKSLQTTVSSATGRYKELNPKTGKLEKTRIFTLRTVDEDDPDGPGARIYRAQ